jgi:hypothetical protein
MRRLLLPILLCLLFFGVVSAAGLPANAVAKVTTTVTPSIHVIPAQEAVATIKPATTTVSPKTFSIISDPPQAEIWINGNKTPILTPFTMGCSELILITLKYPGYQENSSLSGCWYDQSYTLSVTLIPLTTPTAQASNTPAPSDDNLPVYSPSSTPQNPAPANTNLPESSPTSTQQNPAPSVTSGTQNPLSSQGIGSLLIITNPQGARVSVDGMASGVSPVTVPGLSPGLHNVTITMAGYEDLSAQVRIIDGQTMEYTTALVKVTKTPGSPLSGSETALACVAACIILCRVKKN